MCDDRVFLINGWNSVDYTAVCQKISFNVFEFFAEIVEGKKFVVFIKKICYFIYSSFMSIVKEKIFLIYCNKLVVPN